MIVLPLRTCMSLPKTCTPFFVFFLASFLCGNAVFAQNVGINSTGTAPDNSANAGAIEINNHSTPGQPDHQRTGICCKWNRHHGRSQQE